MLRRSFSVTGNLRYACHRAQGLQRVRAEDSLCTHANESGVVKMRLKFRFYCQDRNNPHHPNVQQAHPWGYGTDSPPIAYVMGCSPHPDNGTTTPSHRDMDRVGGCSCCALSLPRVCLRVHKALLGTHGNLICGERPFMAVVCLAC